MNSERHLIKLWLQLPGRYYILLEATTAPMETRRFSIVLRKHRRTVSGGSILLLGIVALMAQRSDEPAYAGISAGQWLKSEEFLNQRNKVEFAFLQMGDDGVRFLGKSACARRSSIIDSFTRLSRQLPLKMQFKLGTRKVLATDEIRLRAIELIGYLGILAESAVPDLLRLIRDDTASQGTRRNAIHVLGAVSWEPSDEIQKFLAQAAEDVVLKQSAKQVLSNFVSRQRSREISAIADRAQNSAPVSTNSFSPGISFNLDRSSRRSLPLRLLPDPLSDTNSPSLQR